MRVPFIQQFALQFLSSPDLHLQTVSLCWVDKVLLSAVTLFCRTTVKALLKNQLHIGNEKEMFTFNI